MSKPLAILAVDDRPQNLRVLERILADVDATLVKATSGDQALAATLHHDFALALLDVQMPGMDGYELAELLRGDPKTRRIPIIFLTAASRDEEQIFKGYESGAVDYIVKPYHPAILISKVKVLLEMQAQAAELRRHRERLASVNQELEAFSYSVSHDLRTPLRAIEGFSRALVEDCSDRATDDERDLLNRIAGEAERMSQLIDALLVLSRVSRAEMSWAPVDLGGMAHEIVAQLREQAPDREVEVRIGDDLEASGDPGLLRQVLENLLGNAFKFTAATARATIEVGWTGDPEQGAFHVRDNGAGFDMKYSDKLFIPFQRMHSQQEFPGTGIGLSTVKRIVARHGGRIWCESTPGSGTTFYFTLSQPQDQEGT